MRVAMAFDAVCIDILMRVPTVFDVRCNDISFAVQCYLMRCTNNIWREVQNSHCKCWWVLMFHIATRCLVHKCLDACIARFQTNLVDMHNMNWSKRPTLRSIGESYFQLHWLCCWILIYCVDMRGLIHGQCIKRVD